MQVTVSAVVETCDRCSTVPSVIERDRRRCVPLIGCFDMYGSLALYGSTRDIATPRPSLVGACSHQVTSSGHPRVISAESRLPEGSRLENAQVDLQRC